MANSTAPISDLGHWNTLEEGEASKEDGGHRSRTATIDEPQCDQLKKFFSTRWDIIFIVSSAFSLFVDPLICYIVVVVEEDTCYFWDEQLMWTFLALRSVGDLFYYKDIDVFLKRIRTKHSAKSSVWASFKKAIGDHLVTTHRNFIPKTSVMFVAILPRIWIALPIPQAILLIGKYTHFDNSMLFLLIPFQYTLRAYKLYQWLDWRVNVDFFPFIIASYLYGSMWYFFAVDRERACWQEYICKHEKICDYSFYCGYSSQKINETIPRLKLSCPVELQKNMASLPFDYGIYLSALQSNMTTSTDLPKKILHCVWWGLRNLSSFGSNLQTSFNGDEIIFSFMISISGLILFLVYLNSRVQGLEKRAERRRLRRLEVTYADLTEQIRHLRTALLRKVPILGSKDKQVLEAICVHLKPEIYAKDVHIIREGEPLRKMLFIRVGTVLTYTTSKGATSACNFLKKNESYGEELVIWAFKFGSPSELPICTTTLVSQSKVEAFSITANHLQSVVAELWWHFKTELPYLQVKSFAASSLQAAWRRHYAKQYRRHQLVGWDK